MEQIKNYLIIYEDVDHNEREVIWTSKNQEEERLADDIRIFITTGEWPERDDKGFGGRLAWGIRVIKYCNSKAQFLFYSSIIKKIAYEIGEACARDRALADSTLAKARSKAKARDKEFVELLLGVGTEVNEEESKFHIKEMYKVKNRILINTKKSNQRKVIQEYAQVIEEYEMYNIVSMDIVK